MEWIVNLFSGDPRDLSRINMWGLLVLVVGVALFTQARRLAGEEDKRFYVAKLIGVLLVGVGALLTMKII